MSINKKNEKVQENKMGVMPVNKLLISMSLPMMISMLVQALYNIVDSYFVAKISEDALSAVSLAFPIQTLMIAIMGGSSVGLGTVLSHSLGEKKFKKVTDVVKERGWELFDQVRKERSSLCSSKALPSCRGLQE